MVSQAQKVSSRSASRQAARNSGSNRLWTVRRNITASYRGSSCIIRQTKRLAAVCCLQDGINNQMVESGEGAAGKEHWAGNLWSI